MSDREKVIKGLECCTKGDACISECPYFKKVPMRSGQCIITLQADALVLLKEQDEPIKPTLNESHSYVSDAFKCGKCGHTIRFHAKYCEECGQAVKWE